MYTLYTKGMISIRFSRCKIYYSPESEDSAMTMFRVTYRKLSGAVDSVVVYANNPSDAKSAFYAKYDGRIISIDQI